MTTAELIERLERAEGPSRELDYRVWRAWRNENFDLYAQASYTASIDAALTLVPDGCKWAVTSRNSACCSDQEVTPLDWVFASTPAIALCIAALKAKEADNG